MKEIYSLSDIDDIIDFTLALAVKEAGIDIISEWCYAETGDLISPFNKYKSVCYAPTTDQLFRYFKDNGFIITIKPIRYEPNRHYYVDGSEYAIRYEDKLYGPYKLGCHFSKINQFVLTKVLFIFEEIFKK